MKAGDDDSKASGPQGTHAALSLLVGKGRNIWGPDGRGMVDPGMQVALFLVPSETVTQEGMELLEQQANEYMKAIEIEEVPAFSCHDLHEVLDVMKRLHGES